MKKRTFVDITRDLVLAQSDYEIYNEEDLMARVNELYDELRDKEDGVYWMYQESEKHIEMFENQIKKMQDHVKLMKRAQERIKGLVIGSYEEVQQLPAHSTFNPLKISQSAGAVDIIDESTIPPEYFIEKTELKLDKKRILDELKKGDNIPGVRIVRKNYVRGLK
ncbi:TPA: hypothetical protein HA278_08470 [Candidatus Woesearchaeota archaeon]|nr:hypothetical protein [Candidatus Woesearchaeota archaeon]